jgi:hypothetical protein
MKSATTQNWEKEDTKTNNKIQYLIVPACYLNFLSGFSNII